MRAAFPKPNIERRIGNDKAIESQWDSACGEKTMHKRSSAEEYLELAEMCLLEAERTLDRETVERLLTMARRYLEEAKRIKGES